MTPTSVILRGAARSISLEYPPVKLQFHAARHPDMIYGASHLNLHFRPLLFRPISQLCIPLRSDSAPVTSDRPTNRPTGRRSAMRMRCGGCRREPAHLHPQNSPVESLSLPRPHPPLFRSALFCSTLPGHGTRTGCPRHRNATRPGASVITWLVFRL